MPGPGGHSHCVCISTAARSPSEVLCPPSVQGELPEGRTGLAQRACPHGFAEWRPGLHLEVCSQSRFLWKPLDTHLSPPAAQQGQAGVASLCPMAQQDPAWGHLRRAWWLDHSCPHPVPRAADPSPSARSQTQQGLQGKGPDILRWTPGFNRNSPTSLPEKMYLMLQKTKLKKKNKNKNHPGCTEWAVRNQTVLEGVN